MTTQKGMQYNFNSMQYCYNLSYKLFFFLSEDSPSLGGPLHKTQVPEADCITTERTTSIPVPESTMMQTLHSVPSTGSMESGDHLLPSSQFPIHRDRIQSSNSTESTDSATSSSSTGSGGSGDRLLPPSTSASVPSHPAPAKSPQLLYAQLNVKQTQVSPPANDDHVQYAQIEHQDNH